MRFGPGPNKYPNKFPNFACLLACSPSWNVQFSLTRLRNRSKRKAGKLKQACEVSNTTSQFEEVLYRRLTSQTE